MPRPEDVLRHTLTVIAECLEENCNDWTEHGFDVGDVLPLLRETATRARASIALAEKLSSEQKD